MLKTLPFSNKSSTLEFVFEFQVWEGKNLHEGEPVHNQRKTELNWNEPRFSSSKRGEKCAVDDRRPDQFQRKWPENETKNIIYNKTYKMLKIKFK